MNEVRQLPTVLIVDDDAANLEVLSEALAVDSLDIAVASDGEMALEHLCSDSADLVLLDAVMPIVDGFEVCRRLKENPDTKDIPVIFMTALSDNETKLRALRLGAVDFIPKPFEQEEVRLRVRNQIAMSRMARVLHEKNHQLEREMERRLAAESARQLAVQVAERNAAELRVAKERLESELAERKRAEAERADLSDKMIQFQSQRLRELSVPIIPISDRVVVMPLIGAIDAPRAELVMETALTKTVARNAAVIIIDVTGVSDVDESFTTTLVRTAVALRLLGTCTILTGIRSEVARLFVTYDLSLEGIQTRATLQDGIAHAWRLVDEATAKRTPKRRA